MNQPNHSEQNHYAARDASRKLKLGIIVVIIGLIVFGILSMILISILDDVNAQFNERETETQKGSSIIFVERDDDYDVNKDAAYLAKDRQIYLTNDKTGETVVLNERNINKYGDAAPVLYGMIQAIIRGDADAYNELFSTKYYKDNEPEAPFRMQPLYDVYITEISQTDMNTYTLYEFEVTYKIRGNDGTFRTDIGHDESRRQRFILSDSTGKSVLIDEIR